MIHILNFQTYSLNELTVIINRAIEQLKITDIISFQYSSAPYSGVVEHSAILIYKTKD